jgi:hypothetical protein
MRRDSIVSPYAWDLDTVLTGLEIANCMNQTFLSISQPLSTVKLFHFVFDKAIFQYPAHNNKSLIAMLSHKNTVHIVTTKAISDKINVTEGGNSCLTVVSNGVIKLF